jgi:uncharacterized OB-fold protein
MIEFETAALNGLYSKKLVAHSCQSCGKLYYVFRGERELDKPIIACCVCQHPDKPYLETYQTAAMLRVR